MKATKSSSAKVFAMIVLAVGALVGSVMQSDGAQAAQHPTNNLPASLGAPSSGPSHASTSRNNRPAAVCSNPYVLYNGYSGKVLEVYHSGTANGSNVDQWAYNGTLTQKWCTYVVDHVDSLPVYELVNDNSGKCLDLSNGNTSNGANVWQWDCLHNANQQWVVTVVDNSWVFAPNTTKNSDCGWCYVMEVYAAGTADGDNVDLWVSHDGANQRWHQ